MKTTSFRPVFPLRQRDFSTRGWHQGQNEEHEKKDARDQFRHREPHKARRLVSVSGEHSVENGEQSVEIEKGHHSLALREATRELRRVRGTLAPRHFNLRWAVQVGMLGTGFGGT